jgi:hypothetical protein
MLSAILILLIPLLPSATHDEQNAIRFRGSVLPASVDHEKADDPGCFRPDRFMGTHLRCTRHPRSMPFHLRHLITEFMGHYLTERHHQGIGSQIIRPKASPGNDNATLDAIECRSRLGGLLNYYYREAA